MQDNEQNTALNSYEARQEARRARYLARAEQAEAQSNASALAAIDMVGILPAGQPIVENSRASRHRNLLDRADNKMRQSVELDKKAAYYREKADAVGRGGISGDDPDAIAKLQEYIAEKEAWQKAMKDGNALFRKGKASVESLKALGVPEKEITYALDRGGFPHFMLRNNNNKIKSAKNRVAELQALAQIQPLAEENALYALCEDRETNRYVVSFHAGKPASEIIDLMKRAGYRWAPSLKAWVRQITANARSTTKQLIASLQKYSTN